MRPEASEATFRASNPTIEVNYYGEGRSTTENTTIIWLTKYCQNMEVEPASKQVLRAAPIGCEIVPKDVQRLCR